MGKIRINKLALELNVQNDQIIDELKKRDVPVKNHMSSIEEEMAETIRGVFAPPAKEEKPKKKASTKKAATKKATKKAAAKKPAAKAEDKKSDKAPAKKTATKKAATKASTKTASKKADKPETKTETNKKAEPKKPAAKKPVPPKPKAAPKKAEKAKAPAKAQPARKLGLKIVKKEEQEEKERQEKKAQEERAAKEKQEKAKQKKPEPAPKAKKEPEKKAPEPETAEPEAFETVQIKDHMPLRELADTLKCSPNEIIKDLMDLGLLATINQSLDSEIASKIADKRGFEVELVAPEAELEFEEEEEDNKNDHVPRSPIVTIMGHVDHGKTSLLDAIRKTRVTDSEHGGITQHIGAYQVGIKGHSITFLDTPGHEAFTAMRARGAQVTDIVILVVAADDGLKPQTTEAIDHARAANVPIVVAINKIDKPDARPDDVQKQLADYGLLPEDWGGNTIFTQVSALAGTGLDHLLEMILLQAEILELKGNPKLRGRGVVIESHLDRGRGPVATVIVEKGLLKVGDPFIVGNYFGKVRALTNDKGKNIQNASLSTPVEVVGLPEVPSPGDRLMVVNDERKARQLSTSKLQRERETQLSQKPRITMEDLHQQIEEGTIQELALIVKADVQGSIQAVKEAFGKLGTELVRIKVIHGAVGGITESDVLLASASNAIIIGFNVRPTEQASTLASKDQVDIRMYSVIYDAINDMKKALDGMLEPTFREQITGRVEVREIFTIPKIGVVAGCYVLSGNVERNTKARLLRDNIVIYDGKIGSLRRFKDDVKEVQSGYECGLTFEKYQDLKGGDVVETYMMEEVPRG